MSAKILAIDIETTLAKAYTFSLFKPVIGHQQIIEPSRIMCFSAQWKGDKKVQFYSEWEHGYEGMLEHLHRLVSEADILVHYNGNSFDLPWIKGELMVNGFDPLPPVQNIDLYQFFKRHTRFMSKKLDYVVERMQSDRKITHEGVSLWIDVQNGVKKAQDKMKKYAVKDTKLLFPLYDKVKAWIPTHPNLALYNNAFEIDAKVCCPVCESESYQRRGFYYTNASAFQRLRCNDCGKWFRYFKREGTNKTR